MQEKKYYAVLTSNYISISPDENVAMVKMLLSEPVERKKITSVEMLNQHAFNLIMDDNSEDYFLGSSPESIITIKKDNLNASIV